MTEVEVPGGTATLRDPGALAVRHRRPLQVLTGALGRGRMMEIVAAQEPSMDGAIAELGLTETELELMERMTDATIWALLESWTLDIPVPASAAEVLDMPGEVYDALALATGKAFAAHAKANGLQGPGGVPIIDPFTVDAVEDPGSPTGASAG